MRLAAHSTGPDSTICARGSISHMEPLIVPKLLQRGNNVVFLGQARDDRIDALVRHRTQDQRLHCARAPGIAPRAQPPARCRARDLATRAAWQLSSKSETARAVDYSLRHWSGLTRFVADSAGLACGPARALPSAPRRDQSRSRVGYARKILGWDRDGASRSSRRGPTRMRTTAVMRTAVINCNHLVGDSEQRLRHVDAQQPCGL